MMDEDTERMASGTPDSPPPLVGHRVAPATVPHVAPRSHSHSQPLTPVPRPREESEGSAHIPKKLEIRNHKLTKWTISPSNSHLILGGDEGFVQVELNGLQVMDVKFNVNGLPGNTTLDALQWNAKDETVFASGMEDIVYIWKKGEAWDISQTIKTPHGNKLSDIAWSPLDAEVLSTCSSDGTINVWNIRGGTTVKSLHSKIPATKLAWSPFDKDILASLHQESILLWDMKSESGDPVCKVSCDSGQFVAFHWSPRFKNTLLTNSTGRIKVWNLKEENEEGYKPKCVSSKITHKPIEMATFTPFGNGVAVLFKNSQLVQLYNAFPEEALEVDCFGRVHNTFSHFFTRKMLLNGIERYQLVCWNKKSSQIEVFDIDNWHIQSCTTTSSPVATARPLEEEFETLQPVAGAVINKFNKTERELEVYFDTGITSLLYIKMNFPLNYPSEHPLFIIMENKTTDPSEQIIKELTAITSKTKNCIETCLKFLSFKYILSHANLLGNNLASSSPQPVRGKENSQDVRISRSGSLNVRLNQLGPDFQTYITMVGDTVPSIALKFNMDKKELIFLNNITSSMQLYPGKLIIVKKPPVGQIEESPFHPHVHTRSHAKSLNLNRSKYEMSALLSQVVAPVCLPIDDVPDLSGNAVNPPSSPPREEKVEPSPDERNINNTESPQQPEQTSPTPHQFDSSNTIVKGKTQYIEMPQFNYVNGILTITSKQIIFEPNLDDPFVIENGVLKYTIVIELASLIDTVQISKYFHMSNGGEMGESNNQDDNGNHEAIFPDKSMFLLLAVSYNDTNQTQEEEPQPQIQKTKIYYFMDSSDRIKKISQFLELATTKKVEYSLKQYFNLDEETVTERHKVVFGEALEMLRNKFPKQDMSLLEGVGTLLSPSQLIDENAFKNLRRRLPMRFRDHNWKLLFNSSSDGTSLITFYSKLYDSGPTIILIEDKAGHVFGGYASEDWKVQPRYFGTGESFVFAVKPKFTVYNWTSANDYFIQANHHYIAMGGGTNGGYAFYLDSELHWGTSETSNTFLNRQLSSTKEFYCTVVEVWGFSI